MDPLCLLQWLLPSIPYRGLCHVARDLQRCTPGCSPGCTHPCRSRSRPRHHGSLVLHGKHHEATTLRIEDVGEAFQDVLLLVAELIQVIFQESGRCDRWCAWDAVPVRVSMMMYSIQLVVLMIGWAVGDIRDTTMKAQGGCRDAEDIGIQPEGKWQVPAAASETVVLPPTIMATRAARASRMTEEHGGNKRDQQSGNHERVRVQHQRKHILHDSRDSDGHGTKHQGISPAKGEACPSFR